MKLNTLREHQEDNFWIWDNQYGGCGSTSWGSCDHVQRYVGRYHGGKSLAFPFLFPIGLELVTKV